MAARKKFTIRPFKPKPDRDESWATEKWEFLKDGLTQVFEQNASHLSYEELYRTAYYLVLHRHGRLLYEEVAQFIESNLRRQVGSVLEDVEVLSGLVGVWDRFCVTMREVRGVLSYMDRVHVTKERVLPVFDLGLSKFFEVVVCHPEVRRPMRERLLQLVSNSREGQPIEKGLMREVLSMLMMLGVGSARVYMQEFEEPFLRDTAVHYSRESRETLAAHPLPAYLRLAHQRFEEETARVRDYLADTTARKLSDVMEQCWVANNASVIMEGDGDVGRMLADGSMEDLSLLYRLFALVHTELEWTPPPPPVHPKDESDRPGGAAAAAAAAKSEAVEAEADGSVGGSGGDASRRMQKKRRAEPLDMLRETMKAGIMEAGRKLVVDTEQSKDPLDFVTRMLALRKHYGGIVHTAFGDDPRFVRGMKEAFEWFVNLDTKCAHFLAMFTDAKLRGGFRGETPQAVDETLEDVITAFRFVRDKDVFEAHYKQYLQKRLLAGRSVSDDAERAMISKLKAECGAQFTSKLEGMFGDLAISREQLAAYRRARGPAPVGVDMEATVLTTVNWPAPNTDPCRLPPLAQKAADHFREWYLSVHSGRRLTWCTAQGTAELRLLYTDRPYEIVVSTYQMCILHLFNDTTRDALSLTEIAAATAIPAEELRRHLISLTTPRARILLRSKPKSSSSSSSADTFAVNTKFASPKLKNRVHLVTLRSARAGTGPADPAAAAAGDSGGTGAGGVPAHVEAARRNMIDAAIVRIMKARKTLDHASLVEETTRQLQTRFRPAIPDIKRRIENLIDRDYLERDEEDRRLYSYVA